MYIILNKEMNKYLTMLGSFAKTDLFYDFPNYAYELHTTSECDDLVAKLLSRNKFSAELLTAQICTFSLEKGFEVVRAANVPKRFQNKK